MLTILDKYNTVLEFLQHFKALNLGAPITKNKK